MEKHILKLDYEIRGAEHLPKKGSFIVAAKHESAYETFKLHRLFDDPAIILKQELLNIPIWGKFLAKTDPIAIDRSAGKRAIEQIIDRAQEIKNDDRPIIIFPQGTRVSPFHTIDDKPYKIGVIKIHDATGLPIIPLAMNSGSFWPKKGWIKRPGTVIFEFLPAIENQDTQSGTLQTLAYSIETASRALQPSQKKQHEIPA